jgi:hypothetical protein
MMYPLRWRCCIAPALAVSLLGCSIRPLPENSPLNFPRASTYDIVQRVRCEAKEGLDRFRDSRRKDHIDLIVAATSIGFDFQFTMSETNNLVDGQLGLRGRSPNITSRRLDVDLTGKVERTRSNTRTFRIIEDLADVDNADCSIKAGPNLAYPISGKLQIGEIVRTYLQLERISDLDEPERETIVFNVPEGTGSAKAERKGVFSEQLDFRATLTGGATPKLVLDAVAGGFRITNARVTGVATRNDTHSLIVAFAQDPNFNDEKVRRAIRERKTLIGRGRKLVRGARSETALAQESSAFARNRVNLELARLRNLRDDEQESSKFLGRQLLKFLRPPDENGPDD